MTVRVKRKPTVNRSRTRLCNPAGATSSMISRPTGTARSRLPPRSPPGAGSGSYRPTALPRTRVWLNLENGSDAEGGVPARARGRPRRHRPRNPSGNPVPGVGLSIFREGSNEHLLMSETDAAVATARAPPLNVSLFASWSWVRGLVHEAIATRPTSSETGASMSRSDSARTAARSRASSSITAVARSPAPS